jgi:muramoyltetrapeptide carboxypeptidase LdcA involved in peptidoglycan recycling
VLLHSSMHPPAYPPKPRSGDRVGIVSPSAGHAGRFPATYELGLRRLRDELGLTPVEYPHTRALAATPRERADDLHAAFVDPRTTAVLAAIGGDDLVTVLRHLDGDLFRSHPKPFFGYSDNTNLLLYLRELGIVGYHGTSVLVQLARPGRTHPITMDSLRAALFSHDWYELSAPAWFTDEPGCDWNDPETLGTEPVMQPAPGWTWRGPDRIVEAPTWGGNLEALSALLQIGRWIRPVEEYTGCVLVLETSEELPSAMAVYRILRSMGERELLRQFPAILVGRAKAWHFTTPLKPVDREVYRAAQREAIIRVLDEYHPRALVVFDVDFGHTDPQMVIPIGGMVRVDGPNRRIAVRY